MMKRDLELLDVSQTMLGGRPFVSISLRMPLENLECLLEWLDADTSDHPNLQEARAACKMLDGEIDRQRALAAIAAAPPAPPEPPELPSDLEAKAKDPMP